MKASRFMVLFAVLSVGAALFFAACNDRNNVSGPRQQDFDVAQFAIIDFTDVKNGVEDATIESEMTFNSTMLDYTVMGSERPFGPGHDKLRGMRWYDRFDFGKHLGFFFKQLNLTHDQRMDLRNLAKTFHTNTKPLVRQFHEANKSIMQDANAKRKLIMDDVKAGNITREEAAARINDLNQVTRELIEANPASQTIKAAMCAERDILFAGVRAVLQGDQITKWENWIAKIKDPCIP